MEEVRQTIKKLEEKLAFIHKTAEELAVETVNDTKVLDLEDRTGDRKYAKTKADQYANEFLSEKMSYVLGKVIKNEQGEEEFKEIKIDGA
jgi:hypothetical protein